MTEALFYKKVENLKVQCELCPHYCMIKEDQTGICKTYKNILGQLKNTRYGQIASIAMDPIEKKPLNHFYPHSYILSAGFYGCNLTCQFCQNNTLSFGNSPAKVVNPEELVLMAKANHSIGIAFTYNEPFTMYEYIRDSFQLFRMEKLKTVLVTNGYINKDPLLQILPLVDAMNIDLKSMRDSFYKKICGGSLNPVLDTIQTSAPKCHIEITYLVIPSENDTEEDFNQLTDFLFAINPEIPVHLSRYFPHYKFITPQTPIETLKLGYSIVRQKMKYVYLGNIARGEL